MKTLKKQLSLFLLMVMLLTCFSPASVFAKPELKARGGEQTLAEQAYDEDDFFISGINFNGLTESGKAKLKAKDGKLEFPALKSKHGNDISNIGPGGFKELGIKTVTFSDSIKKIGNSAFYKNEIEKLAIPDYISEIGYSAFSNNKISELKLSENCEIIYPSVFGNNRIKEVDIPEGVREIRVHAFENNPGDPAHDNKVVLCVSDLKKINFYNDTPDTYFIKEKNAEKYLTEDFTYDEKTEYGKSFVEITGLSDSGKEKQKKNHVLNIPSTINDKEVKSIGKNAFANPSQDILTQFTEVTLPQNLKSVGEGAFIGNEISSVELPKTLETIGNNSFAYNKLTQILIPESVKTIGLRAFAENPVKQGDAKIDNIKGKVNVGFEAFGDIIPVYLKTAQKHNVSIDAPEGATVKITPQSPVEENAKVNIDCKFTDETKELLDIKVKTKSGEVKLTGNSFVMPGEDVTVVVRLKDKYSQDKWCVEDFSYETMKVKVKENGEIKEVELNAVKGFSEKGLEKVKTNKDLELPKVDDKGNKLEGITPAAFRGNLGEKRLNTLKIPEGYKVIGSMAFAFNSCGGDLVLPESMELVDMAAFFRNEFTSLTVPSKMTDIPLSMMRGNKLERVIFKGNIETIGRLAFSENRIEEITVPDSLKSIGPQAFATNHGSDEYDGKVVVRTASGQNPNNLQDAENYLINPSNPGSNPPINYKVWTTDDFEYDGQTVKGFSDQGRKKIRKNKNLVIPDNTPSGSPVEIIGIDAFRNLNQGYEIESVKFPDTVTEIQDYALQFNDIDSVKLPRDLKKLGMGVFMMSNVTKVEWNDKLEYIDQACFYMCELGKVDLPASVETVMNASFRKCALKEVKFRSGSKLKTIESLAFADNQLSRIDLPEGIETIGRQAFGDNKFKELDVPESLSEIGFQAFVKNPGVEKYNAVVIHTPEGKNPKGLKDDAGKTFVIDPEIMAGEQDKALLKEVIEKAEKVNQDKLTTSFKGFFQETLKEAKDALAQEDASKAKVAGCAKSLKWAIKRSEISTLMFEKEALDSQAATFDKEKWNAVEVAYKSAAKYLMVINISDTKVEKLINDLDVALKDLKAGGPLEGAKAYEGEFNIEKTHYIEPYTVKVKVWVKDGKIVYVRDNGTVCDDPNEEEEHNRGYYEHAIEILHKYIGKNVQDVMKNNLGSDLGIDSVSGATVSCNALHEAIKDALKKIEDPNITPEPGSQEPSQPSQPAGKTTKKSDSKDYGKVKNLVVKIFGATVYRKAIRISWKRIPGVKGYKVAFKKNKERKWSYKTVKKNYIKIPKMSRKGRLAIKVAAIRKAGKKYALGKYSKIEYFYMTKTKIKKIVAKKKSLLLLWRKLKGATDYQIAYAKNASLQDATYKSIRKNKVLIKGLKKKTRYYVAVRSYKRIAGKIYYGGWSKIKTVTIR